MNKVVFSALLASSLFAQSQPPTPRPVKNTQIDKPNGKDKKTEAGGDQTDANTISFSIDKLAAEVARRRNDQGTQNAQDKAPPDWWQRSTAVATALAAIGTIILARLGFGQLRTLQKQTVQMRESFMSTHRPKLAVRDVEIPHGFFGMGTDIRGTLVVVNTGDTPAVLKKCYIFFSVDFPKRQIPTDAPADAINVKLMSGQYGKLAFPTQQPRSLDIGEYMGLNNRREVEGRGTATELQRILGNPFVIGWVEYSDELERNRRIGFCRVYNYATERFEPYHDPDYEYSD